MAWAIGSRPLALREVGLGRGVVLQHVLEDPDLPVDLRGDHDLPPVVLQALLERLHRLGDLRVAIARGGDALELLLGGGDQSLEPLGDAPGEEDVGADEHQHSGHDAREQRQSGEPHREGDDEARDEGDEKVVHGADVLDPLPAASQGPLSKLVDEADSKSAAADPASRFESGEGHLRLDARWCLDSGSAFWASKVLLTAVEFGLFSGLGDRSMTATELGTTVGSHPRGTYDALKLPERAVDQQPTKANRLRVGVKSTQRSLSQLNAVNTASWPGSPGQK